MDRQSSGQYANKRELLNLLKGSEELTKKIEQLDLKREELKVWKRLTLSLCIKIIIFSSFQVFSQSIDSPK